MKQNKLTADMTAPLFAWYRENRKVTPWRQDPTPYHVWLSEIMLQQTRIEAALPYYLRFLEALPTVEALAAVEEDRLMKLWQGLGYYSRARNLKRAAIQICESYGGALPQTVEELRRLPGIGAYTAGAIASIAYGRPEPAVDGNVLRVVTRLTACGDDITRPAVRSAITEELRNIYPEGEDAGTMTQALMEIGETVCIPNGRPKCAACPLKSFCAGYAQGNPEAFPVKPPKKPRRAEHRLVWILECEDRFALEKRPEKGLLAGLWQFPNDRDTREEALGEAKDGVPEKLRRVGAGECAVMPCGEAVHIFTHIEWKMTGYRVILPPGTAARLSEYTWVTREEMAAHYAVPSAFRAFTEIVLCNGADKTGQRKQKNRKEPT